MIERAKVKILKGETGSTSNSDKPAVDKALKTWMALMISAMSGVSFVFYICTAFKKITP
jgi:hypothetical protein